MPYSHNPERSNSQNNLFDNMIKWPTIIVCKSKPDPLHYAQEYEVISRKLHYHRWVVHSFTKLIEILTTTKIPIFAVWLNLNELQQLVNSDTTDVNMEDLLHSLECITSLKLGATPKWGVHFQGSVSVEFLKQILNMNINFIAHRDEFLKPGGQEEIHRQILAGNNYLSPKVLSLLSGDLPSTTTTSNMCVLEYNTQTSQLVLQKMCGRLENEILTKFCFTSSWAELYGMLTDYSQMINVVVVDAEELVSMANIDLTDSLITLDSMIKLNYHQNTHCLTKPAPLYVKVGMSTDIQLIKKILKFRQVSGLIARVGDGFTYDEIKQSFMDNLLGNYHIPMKIQAQLDVNKHPKKSSPVASGIQLTERQQQILDMVCHKGNSNKMIANSLKVTESTVKVHLSTIMKKYGVKNRTQLAVQISQTTASNLKTTQV